MMKTIQSIIVCLCSAWLASCTAGNGVEMDRNIERAGATLDSLYKYYSVPGTELLRENYPYNEEYTATYFESLNQEEIPKEFTFLWPFTGTFSAVNALLEATGSLKYRNILEDKVLPGLEEFYDIRRQPRAYSSYINSEPDSDRFYDDNIWLGIEYADLYRLTGRKDYLTKAEELWKFVETGMDNELGGGIYWLEQRKTSKNACSNAPGAVLALKLHQATGNGRYLDQGNTLYEWTKNTLRDSKDNLYYDHIYMDGNIDTEKYPYNTGQMIQAAAMLYSATGDDRYLSEAKNTANAAFNYFTREYTCPLKGESFRLLNWENIWFSAVMIRGFAELYRIDGDSRYIDDFARNLDHIWRSSRDEHGFFPAGWSCEKDDHSRWLLDQAGYIEIFARIGSIRKQTKV